MMRDMEMYYPNGAFDNSDDAVVKIFCMEKRI